MSKTKKQVMNFITKDRMRRFPDECGKSTLAKFLHSYFPEKVVDSSMEHMHCQFLYVSL